MRKNTAGQCIKFLLLDTAGAPVTTGTTAVYVAIDAGTQSTGTGTAVHLGNGQWRYPPSQAETNGDCIGYLATNTGAVSTHLLVYTDAHFDPAVDLVDLNADQSTVTVGDVTMSAAERNAMADAILNRDWTLVSDTNARTALNALRALRNKWTAPAGTLTVTKEDDTTSAWTSALTTDAAGLPVTGSDPV